MKFLRTVTADFVDHRFDESTDKTFYFGQIVECDHLEETVNGFVDILWSNDDAAVGIGKQSIQIIEG